MTGNSHVKNHLELLPSNDHNFLPRGRKQLLKPVSESSRHSLQNGLYITLLTGDDLKSVSKDPDQSVTLFRAKADIS